jgi:hypothetical protein
MNVPVTDSDADALTVRVRIDRIDADALTVRDSPNVLTAAFVAAVRVFSACETDAVVGTVRVAPTVVTLNVALVVAVRVIDA